MFRIKGRRGAEEILPAQVISDALKSAEEGEMPPFNSKGLLRLLALEGRKPDGLGLMERLVGNGSLFTGLRASLSVMKHTERLIDVTNEYSANPAQEEMAAMMGRVVSRQFEREGDICDGARSIAMRSTRDDIVPQSLWLAHSFTENVEHIPAQPEFGSDFGIVFGQIGSSPVFIMLRPITEQSPLNQPPID